MEEIMLTGFGFESSMKIAPNYNFLKEKVVYESDRIDTCNLPE